MDDTTINPVTAVASGNMANPRYSILVWPYAFGQYRIQLTDTTRQAPFAPAGHGEIIRELCTYSPETMKQVVAELRQAGDPESVCQSLARPWNCEYIGGRIRLDNTKEDRVTHKQ